MQLYRVLWMYVAVHGLWKDHPGSKGRPQWPTEWHLAAILIAKGPTPLLVAGGEIDVFRVDAGLSFPHHSNLCAQLKPMSSPL